MTVNEKVMPDDHLDNGPMGKYDDPLKPECPSHGAGWVVATGRTSKWRWECTQCLKWWAAPAAQLATKQGDGND